MLPPLYDYEMHNWCILNNVKLHGIYMSDQVFDMQNNTCFIVNLGDSDTNGTHWVGAYVTKDTSFYFDSFGNRPSDMLVDLLKRGGRSLVYNDNILQDVKSASCGYFVLLWLLFMSKGEGSLFDRYYKYVYDLCSPNDSIHNEEVITRLFSNKKRGGEGFATTSGGDIQALVTSILPNTELHLPIYVDGKVQRAAFAGPGTKLDERIVDLDDLVNEYEGKDVDVTDPRIKTKPLTSLDKASMQHDIRYHRAVKQCEGDSRCIIKGKHDADRQMINELKQNLRARRYTNRIDALQSAIAIPVLHSKVKLGVGFV